MLIYFEKFLLRAPVGAIVNFRSGPNEKPDANFSPSRAAKQTMWA